MAHPRRIERGLNPANRNSEPFPVASSKFPGQHRSARRHHDKAFKRQCSQHIRCREWAAFRLGMVCPRPIGKERIKGQTNGCEYVANITASEAMQQHTAIVRFA
jgi:hypothetical protein